MEKLTLTKVFRKEQYSERTKKNYTKLAFKCNEYGDKWVSGFGNKSNASWKEGDTVEVIIEKKATDKGEFINFSLPKEESHVKFNDVEQVKNMLTALMIDVRIIKSAVCGDKPAPADDVIDYPEESNEVEF